jgi:hypothetical protein
MNRFVKEEQVQHPAEHSTADHPKGAGRQAVDTYGESGAFPFYKVTAAVPYRSRVLAALAVLLPVPLLAAAGLSLPLPATVERLAAKLVPFGNASVAAAAATHGSIVPGTGEQPGTVLVHASAASPAQGSAQVLRGSRPNPATPTRPQASSVPSATTPTDAANDSAAASDAAHATPVETAAPTAASSVTPAPPTAPAQTTTPAQQPPPAPAPAPAPTPAQTTTPTPTQVVNNTVTTAASTANDTVNNTVTTATEVVNNATGGLGGKLPHP